MPRIHGHLGFLGRHLHHHHDRCHIATVMISMAFSLLSLCTSGNFLDTVRYTQGIIGHLAIYLKNVLMVMWLSRSSSSSSRTMTISTVFSYRCALQEIFLIHLTCLRGIIGHLAIYLIKNVLMVMWLSRSSSSSSSRSLLSSSRFRL